MLTIDALSTKLSSAVEWQDTTKSVMMELLYDSNIGGIQFMRIDVESSGVTITLFGGPGDR